MSSRVRISTIARIGVATLIRDRMIADGAEPAGGTSQAFDAFIAREVDKWRKVVNMAKIRVDILDRWRLDCRFCLMSI
jgi:hypothetical protein